MTNDTQKQVEKYEAFLFEKKKELLKEKMAVSAFLRSDHTSDKTKEFQASVADVSNDIDKFLFAVMDGAEQSKEAKEAFEGIVHKGEALLVYTDRMSKALADDLIQVQRDEDKNAVNPMTAIKFIAAMATIAVFGAKVSHLDPDLTYSAAEASTGAAVGGAISYRKRLISGFRAATKIVCATPAKVCRGVGYLVAPLNNNKARLILVLPSRNNNKNNKMPTLKAG